MGSDLQLMRVMRRVEDGFGPLECEEVFWPWQEDEVVTVDDTEEEDVEVEEVIDLDEEVEEEWSDVGEELPADECLVAAKAEMLRRARAMLLLGLELEPHSAEARKKSEVLRRARQLLLAHSIKAALDSRKATGRADSPRRRRVSLGDVSSFQWCRPSKQTRAVPSRASESGKIVPLQKHSLRKTKADGPIRPLSFPSRLWGGPETEELLWGAIAREGLEDESQNKLYRFLSSELGKVSLCEVGTGHGPLMRKCVMNAMARYAMSVASCPRQEVSLSRWSRILQTFCDHLGLGPTGNVEEIVMQCWHAGQGRFEEACPVLVVGLRRQRPQVDDATRRTLESAIRRAMLYRAPPDVRCAATGDLSRRPKVSECAKRAVEMALGASTTYATEAPTEEPCPPVDVRPKRCSQVSGLAKRSLVSIIRQAARPPVESDVEGGTAWPSRKREKREWHHTQIGTT